MNNSYAYEVSNQLKTTTVPGGASEPAINYIAASDSPLPLGEIIGGAVLIGAYVADHTVKTHVTYSLTNAVLTHLEGDITMHRQRGSVRYLNLTVLFRRVF